jgi:AAA family ATP:ADP antiporter
MVRLLAKLTGLDEKDAPQAGFAFLFFFCILASYYIVQPLRDELALLVGEEHTRKLFFGSLLVMTIANPLFAFLLNKSGRLLLMKFVYRFFASNIVIFIAIFKYLEATGAMPKHGQATQVQGVAWIMGGIFFLWVSVFNLFAVSVFWTLMADIYSGEQSKRAFGFLGAGGTLGQMFGSALTGRLVDTVGPTNLLWVSVLLLELGVQAMFIITRSYQEPPRKAGEKRPNAISGFTDIVKSPYLLSICLYLFLYTFTSSFIYFQKQAIVASEISDRSGRVGYFSDVNLAISVMTLIIQLFLTGKFLSLIGLSAGLALVPIVGMVGFLALAKKPDLHTIALLDIIRKTSNYAISKPSREVLFTAVSRREKYQAKNFIDTVVYRAGDSGAAAVFELMFRAGAQAATVSMSAVAISVVYLGVGLGLGKAHGRRYETIKASQEGSSSSEL